MIMEKAEQNKKSPVQNKISPAFTNLWFSPVVLWKFVPSD